MIRLAILLALAAAPALAAPSLDLPDSAQETGAAREVGKIALPAGPWQGGRLERVSAEGRILRRAWSLGGRTVTVDQIAGPLRAQLRRQGYEILFDCEADGCGGYDFRFATETLPAPAMFVDLGDYRYLLAQNPEGEVLSLLVSRAGSTGYVQATAVSEAPEETVVASSKSGETDATGGIWDALSAGGRAPLDDLAFATGSSALEDGPFPSLDALAEALAARPEARVALVGHTDTSGPLEANIALSRRRAEAVRDELVDRYGTDPGQVIARGVGYLAPRGSNDTAAGRKANRRVEVVLTE